MTNITFDNTQPKAKIGGLGGRQTEKPKQQNTTQTIKNLGTLDWLGGCIQSYAADVKDYMAAK